jgi:AcrR family transcriptional regulator
MGISERKERERQEMKKAILETAIEMYLKEGFENLSIRAIANQMEYSVGTMYLYYKDKAALLNDLMEEGFKKLVRAYQRLKRVQDPLLNLKNISRKYLDFAFKNPEYYELMFIMTKPPEMDREQEKWQSALTSYKIFNEIVKECVESRSICYKDAGLASLHIWSFLHGLASLYIKKRLLAAGDPKSESLDRTIDGFFDAIKA